MAKVFDMLAAASSYSSTAILQARDEKKKSTCVVDDDSIRGGEAVGWGSGTVVFLHEGNCNLMP